MQICTTCTRICGQRANLDKRETTLVVGQSVLVEIKFSYMRATKRYSRNDLFVCAFVRDSFAAVPRRGLKKFESAAC